MNPAQPPEGILDPKKPYWSADRVGEATWLRLKGNLTGRRVEGLSENFTSYVKLGDADADRLIENLKKWGKYPQLNQKDKSGGAYNAEPYQKWLVEEFLEKPFREEVDKKIEEAAIQSRLKELDETRKEVKEAETKEEVAAVIEDKVEVLEAIKEDMNPRPTENKIPDPWEGSYNTPKSKKKPKRRKLKRPTGVIKKTKKKSTQNKQAPKTNRKTKPSFGKTVGGGLKSIASSIGGAGGTASGGSGGSTGGTYTPTAAGEGPSMLSFARWISGKIKKSFEDAKEEKKRSDEAAANGADIPAEQREKGYFLKKAIGYHFGGEAYDKTFGAFLESKPFKKTSQLSTFSSQFDYGEDDPKAKQKSKDSIKDIGSGFRQVGRSLEKINQSLNTQITLTQKLVSETTRYADISEQISQQLLGLTDIEVNNIADEAVKSKSPDINVDADISIGNEKSGGGLLDTIFDVIDGIDDIADLADRRKGRNINATQKNQRGGRRTNITGDAPKRKSRFNIPKIFGRRKSFASGGIIPNTSVPALVGEAGPEIILRNKTPKKMAAGGVVGGGDVSNISSAVGYGGIKGGEVMGLAQPFTEVMELPIRTSGAIMLANMGTFLRGMGPLGGVFAPIFKPMVSPFSKSFGIDKNVINSALFGALPDRRSAISMLGGIFDGLGIFGKGKKGKKAKQKPPGPPGSGNDFWTLAAVAALEDSTAQGQADVAQSVYNRLANGGWGSTIHEILTGDGQYQVAFTNPTATGGGGSKVADVWKSITDADSAAAAIQYYYEGRGQTVTLEQAKKKAEDAARAISDPSLQQNAAQFVGPRTDFRADQPAGVTDGVERPTGGNYFFNELPRNLQTAAPVPSFAAGGNIGQGKFGKLLGSFIVEGPMKGYPLPLPSNKNIEVHGTERVKIYEKGIAIRPIETPEYSQSKNPQQTSRRNQQLDKEIGLQAAGGLNVLSGLKKFATSLVKKYNPFKAKGLGRGTRATAGFTGMGKAGFDAINAGAKFIESKKAMILGRGAYSAPHINTAKRYAGTSGSFGGKQAAGGIIKTIVPANAWRLNFLEPQSKVRGEVFDKGRVLANKIMSGQYSNSPLANKLKQQMTRGYVSPDLSISGSNLKMLKVFGKVVRIADLPLIGDMLFPESTATYDQISGPNAWYNNPDISPDVKQKMMQQFQTMRAPAPSQSTVNVVTVMQSKPRVIPLAAPAAPATVMPRNSQGDASKAIQLEKLRRHS